MTKKELERRNDYLLLQLKMIHRIATECENETKLIEIAKAIGNIEHYSKAETIKDNLKFIEEYDKNYNFYNKTMDIKEYK